MAACKWKLSARLYDCYHDHFLWNCWYNILPGEGDKDWVAFLITGSSVLPPWSLKEKKNLYQKVISFLRRFFSTFINVKISLHEKAKDMLLSAEVVFFYSIFACLDSDPTVSKWDNMVWRPALCFLVCLLEVKTPHVCLVDSWVVFPLFGHYLNRPPYRACFYPFVLHAAPGASVDVHPGSVEPSEGVIKIKLRHVHGNLIIKFILWLR